MLVPNEVLEGQICYAEEIFAFVVRMLQEQQQTKAAQLVQTMGHEFSRKAHFARPTRQLGAE